MLAEVVVAMLKWFRDRK